MTERSRDEAALSWADSIPDEEDAEGEDSVERPYPDGSAVNECWDDRGEFA